MAKEISEQKDSLPAVLSTFEQDAETIVDNMEVDDIAIPFLKIRQKASKELKQEEGDIFNNVTMQSWKAETGVKVIPVAFRHAWIEWAPRGEGTGAPVNFYYLQKDGKTATDSGEECPKTERDEKYNDVIVGHPNGHYIDSTAQHWVLFLNEDETLTQAAMISMNRTKLKKSRNLNAQIISRVAQGANGPFTPTRFSHVYTLTTVSESNKAGDEYQNWAIEVDRMLDEKNPADMALYSGARTFRKAVKEGSVVVAYDDESDEESVKVEKVEGNGEDIPF